MNPPFECPMRFNEGRRGQADVDEMPDCSQPRASFGNEPARDERQSSVRPSDPGADRPGNEVSSRRGVTALPDSVGCSDLGRCRLTAHTSKIVKSTFGESIKEAETPQASALIAKRERCQLPRRNSKQCDAICVHCLRC